MFIYPRRFNFFSRSIIRPRTLYIPDHYHSIQSNLTYTAVIAAVSKYRDHIRNEVLWRDVLCHRPIGSNIALFPLAKCKSTWLFLTALRQLMDPKVMRCMGRFQFCFHRGTFCPSSRADANRGVGNGVHQIVVMVGRWPAAMTVLAIKHSIWLIHWPWKMARGWPEIWRVNVICCITFTSPSDGYSP
jgi:hypothetical protein